MSKSILSLIALFTALACVCSAVPAQATQAGIDWTIVNSALVLNWLSVDSGNGLFVAMASNGTGNRVMTSPDGITWTAQTSSPTYGKIPRSRSSSYRLGPR